MSSISKSTLGRWLPALASGLLILIALGASFVGGCIRRVPAPTDDAPARSPYSAVATWRNVNLPSVPESGGAPLPGAALRLAIGPSESVWMDSALVDGRSAPVIEQDLASALRALSGRQENIVVLGFDPGLCSTLLPFGERVVVAAGRSAFSEPGNSARAKGETLVGVPLATLCPEPNPAQSATPSPL